MLRQPGVRSVTVVDLDPRVTSLFQSHDDLAALNDNALRDRRVTIINQDAWVFVAESRSLYDVIIADLPDPRSPALSKLYSTEFYSNVARRLRSGGAFVTQAGSPVFARKAFWSVVATVDEGFGAAVTPYHVYVPSFGDWGFAMATASASVSLRAPQDSAYLTKDAWEAAQVFGGDAGRLPVTVNSINDHPLIRYYEEGWAHWYR